MNNPIRLRATSYNVICSFRQASRLRPVYHPNSLPRPFSTNGPLQNPTQTNPLNIDIYIPKESAPSSSLSTILQTPTTSPVLKPVTTHHDLSSYLTQQHHRVLTAPTASARQKLTTSSVHLGTRYEYLIQSHFQQRLGFTLTRIGGKGDGGVDLIGSWTLPVPITPASASLSSSSLKPNDTGSDSPTPPSFRPTFRILLQAKRIAPHRNPMPALMRELDGTILSSSTSRWISAAFAMHGVRTTTQFHGNNDNNPQPPPNPNPDSTHPSPVLDSSSSFSDLSDLPTLGILVTTRPLTSGIEKAMASSRRCLMYICLEEIEDLTVEDEAADGLPGALSVPLTKTRQMAWNAAASRAGLEGYNVVTKYSENDDRDAAIDGEAVMLFQGQPVRAP